MKLKHNKKRNTAVVYEILIKELSRSILQENFTRKNQVFSLLKKYFSKNSVLRKDLELYRNLANTRGIERNAAIGILHESKYAQQVLDHVELIRQQNALLLEVSKVLGKEVFSNFVPRYKCLATIYQIYNNDLTIPERVLLENIILEYMTTSEEGEKPGAEPVDNIIYNVFVKKFNAKYTNLLAEQKALLNLYVGSFNEENHTEFKSFLNTTISGLKKRLQEATKREEVVSNSYNSKSLAEVLSLLETFKTRRTDDQMILQILKIQDLLKEIES